MDALHGSAHLLLPQRACSLSPRTANTQPELCPTYGLSLTNKSRKKVLSPFPEWSFMSNLDGRDLASLYDIKSKRFGIADAIWYRTCPKRVVLYAWRYWDVCLTHPCIVLSGITHESGQQPWFAFRAQSSDLRKRGGLFHTHRWSAVTDSGVDWLRVLLSVEGLLLNEQACSLQELDSTSKWLDRPSYLFKGPNYSANQLYNVLRSGCLNKTSLCLQFETP